MASSSASSSKHLLLLFLVCGVLCSACRLTAARILDDGLDDVLQKFEEWTEKYGRQYKNEAEKLQRLGIFADNLKYLADFLKASGDGRSYTIGLNQFADLTNDEFLASRTGFKLPPTATSEPTTAGPAAAPVSSHQNATTDGGVPSSIDWRTRGAVTAVKNQGSCGSCWAFSAVAAIESAILIKKGQPPTDLSEQELVDCDFSSSGCQGGWMDNAFAFVSRNGGITTEPRYPYVERRGICKVTRLQDHVASISGFRDVPANDEGALMEAVAQQPVSVAIDASGLDFQLYSGGVFGGPCGTTLNHAVTLVGYGEDEQGNEYWIAKNSWGTSWGDEGYVLMKKDVPQKEGLCGIAMVASYPTV